MRASVPNQNEPVEKLLFKLRSEASIASQVPVELINGFKVTSIAITCPDCHRVTNPDHVKGVTNFPSPSVFTIDAAGYCCNCAVLYPVLLRIRAVGKGAQLEYYTKSGWKVSASNRKKKPFMVWIKHFLFKNNKWQ